jgi:hypothetical protein
MKHFIPSITIVICCLYISCETTKIKSISLEGGLLAKNVLTVKYDFPEEIAEPEINWYLSGTLEGTWEKLPGIWSRDLILLTSYVDKYIKCEIKYLNDRGDEIATSTITPKPIEFKENKNTDWFRDSKYGIMVHYLKSAIAPDGGAKEWNNAVDSFDVELFASQAHQAKAGFVMFTLGQNSGYYCSPNATFDKVMGIKPGDLCSKRDLPMDLIKELKKYDIPLILYLPSNPPVRNKLVSEKFLYPLKDTATSQYNQPILEGMIREWSTRYGQDVKGWWFDGLYQWNNIRETRMDMSLKHNISTHTLAAKAGNKESIVTYNSGFGKIKANTPYCDYTSGEKSTLDETPEDRWISPGVQWFIFTYLGEKWGGKGQQFETGELVEKASHIVEKEGVLCLEVVTNSQGEILNHHFEQIKAVGENLNQRLTKH